MNDTPRHPHSTHPHCTHQVHRADRVGRTRRVRRGVGFAASILAAAVLSACGQTGSASGDLATGKRLLQTCHDKPVAALVAFDVSGSMTEPQLSAQRQAMVTDAAQRVAVCGGSLRVLVFSTSSASTGVLYDQRLQPSGATENARLRRSLKQARDALSQVVSSYTSNPAQLSPNGSDILGTYLLAGQYFSQLGDGYGARLFLVDTDGFATSGVAIGNDPMTPQAAKDLAAKATVPALPGVAVTVAGLGKVNGTPPDSAVVAGLAGFYDAVCAKIHAASCTSVTDYIGGQS